MPASAASSDKPVAVIVRYELYETQGQKRVAIRYADDVEEDRPSTELEEHLLSARSAGVACKYTKGRCLRERCNAVLCCEAEECARSAERASPDVEKMLDNAACAAQVLALMRTDDGRETALREAVRLNVVEPLLRFAHYATRLTADEHQLISTAALHLATWATSSNKEPYGNTLDVARRLEAFLSGTERTGNG